jgi:FecR protein/Glucodextranase, domain B
MSLVVKIIICILIISLTNGVSAQETVRKCNVKSLVGSVKIRRGATVNWFDAKPGMIIRERDAVRTFIESEAELETSEGTSLKIGENTTIEMAQLFQKGDQKNTRVRIMNGSLMSNVKKLVGAKSSFEFETPTATAAIRGTIVGLDVTKEKTLVKVYEGTVSVSSSGSTLPVILKENQMTSVVKGQKTFQIEIVDAARERTGQNTAADSVKIDLEKADSLKVLKKTDTLLKDTSEIHPDTLIKRETGINVPVSGLNLFVSSPGDGFTTLKPFVNVSGRVTAGADLLINGMRQQISEDGSFSIQFGIKSEPGDQAIEIEAQLNSKSQKVSKIVRFKPVLMLNVTAPLDKQTFTKTIIPVKGKVTPGAETFVNGMKVLVTSDGSFSGSVAIPNESGEIPIDISASLDGAQMHVNRVVLYKPEYRFTLLAPSEKQVITTTQISIKGEVQPSSATVSVNDRQLTVSQNGAFGGFIQIPDEEGLVVLEFEINAYGLTRTENRTVVYKRPPDVIAPEIQGILPDRPTQASMKFAVIDRTPDEEITFIYEIDGVRVSETGVPNFPFTVPLENGTHTYVLYARDKAGNVSSKLLKTITYMSTSTWNITPRKPSGVEYIDIPPSAPDYNYNPRYTIEVSIENLPDDNMSLIREVTILNQTTGVALQMQTFTSNYIQRDFELAPRKANIFQIDVTDINGVRKTIKVQVILR